jgi:hypothetical protein
VRRAFENWWTTDFVDFWKDDIPKALNWLVGSDSNGWRRTVVIIVVVVVIIVIVVLIAVATDGAGDEVLLDLAEDSSSTLSGGLDGGSLDISATNLGYDVDFDAGFDGGLDINDVADEDLRPSVYQNGRLTTLLDDSNSDQIGTIVEENEESMPSYGLVKQ